MPPMLFFLHMPRTGGTTLNTVLKANFAPEEILSIYQREDYERCRELEPAQLDGIRLVIGHLLPQSVEPPRFYDREVRIQPGKGLALSWTQLHDAYPGPLLP